MRYRVIGAVLFGIGVLFLVFAAGLAFIVAPAVTKLPYDLEPSASVAEAPGARFLQIKKVGDDIVVNVNQATLESITKVTPNRKVTADLTGDLDSSAVVWTVGQTVRRTDTTELVNAYSAELALDRVSGEGLLWERQWLDESDGVKSEVNFEGQVYKFPFRTEKKDYRIYDRDLRAALPARYQGTETIEGLEVYRFEQVIADQEQKVDQGRMAVLLGRFAEGATTGEIVYSNTRTVWVEPLTGSYLKVREVQHKVLVPDSGSQTVLLEATFEYTPDTVKASAERARDSRLQLQLVGLYGPIGLALLGLAAIIGGLLLARRAERVYGQPRHRADDEVSAEDTTAAHGPLTDELPPATHNWQPDDPTVPEQRSWPGEVERR